MGPDLVAGPAFNYGYAGSSFGRGAGFFNVRPDAGANPPNPSLRFATANVQRMIVTNTGDVGIGITAPTAKLDVTGTINTLTQYNIGGSRVLSVPGGSASNTFAGVFAGDSNTTGAQNSFFGRSAGFNNNGGAGNAFFGFKAGDVNSGGFNNTAIGSGANFGSGFLTNATALGFLAEVDASNSLVLGSINGVNGSFANTKVGIGVIAPLATLHVVSFSNTAADNTATFEAPTIGSNQSHIHWGTTGDWYIRSAASAGQVILQDTGGNVGIGTASPDQRLTVNGEANKPGGGSWDVFSDERLKNIKGRFTPGLKAVMQLQPLRYEYKPDNALGLRSSGEHIGFGAQAVQKIIPEAVTRNDKGYLLVNNDPILWTMLNAIKEQQKEIQDQRLRTEQQHQQLQQKRAQMEKLERRLAALEMMLRKSSRQRPRR